jgi:uncharacterized membrane protein
MNLIGWLVIVPFSLAALLSGLVQSLTTQWGLFRHWWIVVKLVLTVVAVIVLLRHMEAVSRMARIAAEATPLGTAFPRATNCSLGPSFGRFASVARGHDAIGLQAVGNDSLWAQSGITH